MREKRKDLVSVVIPVYNAQKYLAQTVESVLKQTYSDVEIILVDDCSIDGSLEMEKEYASKYENIILVQNESNSGQTLSRNHGLKNISGEWFLFLDADDELCVNAIETMLNVAIENDVDIVMCDYCNIFQDGRIVNNTALLDEGKYSGLEITNNLFRKIPSNILSCVGTKLYKSSFLEKKRPTSDYPRTGGDFMFIMDSLLSSPDVYYLKKILYKYYVRSQSISNSYRVNMYDDLMKTRSGLWELYDKYGLTSDRAFELAKLRYEIIYSSIAQETGRNRVYDDYKKMYHYIFKDEKSHEAIRIILKNDCSLKRRIIMKLFKYPFVLYLFIKLRMLCSRK